ncbi:MAG: Drug resistance transporter, EmrB/QacA subfamily [Actinomycetia bacterium]|nr:Drug resistance transporter, EmrB/QacA subfamily [Actinomycetes bacterium]
MSAFASDATVLIGTRALMGIGGAFIMPSTLSILTNVFTNPAERAKAIGIWAGVAALGIGIGPVAGGELLAHFWWGSVFLVNIPIVLLGLVLGYMLIPESRDPSVPRLDPLGSFLSIAGLGSVLWAIIEGPSHGWTSTSVLGGFVVGAAILGAFLAWELHTDHPMLDIRFFENPRFSAASGAITLTFLSLFGTIFLLTQYLQLVLGYSTVKAGAVLIPQAAVLMLFAPMSTRWVRRFGNKVVVVTGMVIVAASLLLMTTFTTTTGVYSVILIAMLLGLGMANIMAPATESIMGSLPREKAGVGSAMNDTTRQVGGAVGVALLGSILSSRYGSSVSAALRGHVPAAIAAKARDSVGSAVSLVNENPAAKPYASQIANASRHAFVLGMHTAVVVAAVTMLIGAAGVLRWLPARATGDEPSRRAADVLPELGPVDVVPAVQAAELAVELEEQRDPV